MEMGGGLGLGCNSSSTSSDNSINNNSLREVWLPPGFRFHPTDEELLSYYLLNKIKRELEREREEERESPYHTTQMQIEDSLVVIDLNKCEPWDLPEKAKIGEKEWYVYSRRDKKYPSGIRNNRATKRGYWKATGNDRPITATASPKRYLVGMKKTLVFYTGRAPHGSKTNWVMHEYRLNTRHFPTLPDSSKDKWVLCRLFNKGGQGEKKPIPHILNQTQSFPSQFASENVSLLSTSSLAMGKHSWHQEEDKEEEEECSTIESLLSQQHQLPSWTSFPDLVESLAYGQLIDQGCLHSLVNNKTSTATYSNYSYSPFLDLDHDVLY